MAVATSFLRLGLASAVLCALAPALPSAQEGPGQRTFTVVARKYAFEPVRLEANVDDLVRVTLSSPDIAHSFTIDAYRVSKRANAGQSVIFEFRADQAGTFPFYCDLQNEAGCRKMRGELVVKPHR